MLEVDKKTFEPEVLQAEGYVLVDFFGDGCVPCQALMPHSLLCREICSDKIKFTSLNTTKNVVLQLVRRSWTSSCTI